MARLALGIYLLNPTKLHDDNLSNEKYWKDETLPSGSFSQNKKGRRSDIQTSVNIHCPRKITKNYKLNKCVAIIQYFEITNELNAGLFVSILKIKHKSWYL